MIEFRVGDGEVLAGGVLGIVIDTSGSVRPIHARPSHEMTETTVIFYGRLAYFDVFKREGYSGFIYRASTAPMNAWATSIPTTRRIVARDRPAA